MAQAANANQQALWRLCGQGRGIRRLPQGLPCGWGGKRVGGVKKTTVLCGRFSRCVKSLTQAAVFAAWKALCLGGRGRERKSRGQGVSPGAAFWGTRHRIRQSPKETTRRALPGMEAFLGLTLPCEVKKQAVLFLKIFTENLGFQTSLCTFAGLKTNQA